MLTKIYFPRLIVPASAVIVNLVDFLISFVLLGVLMAWYRFVPGWRVLTLPVITSYSIHYTKLYELGRAHVPLAQLPAALGPGIGFLDGHFLGQIHALQAREALGQLQRLGLVQVAAGHDAAGLGTGFPQPTGQLAGIDVGDAHHLVALEVFGEGFLTAEVGGDEGKVANDEALGVDAGGFFVFSYNFV